MLFRSEDRLIAKGKGKESKNIIMSDRSSKETTKKKPKNNDELVSRLYKYQNDVKEKVEKLKKKQEEEV